MTCIHFELLHNPSDIMTSLFVLVYLQVSFPKPEVVNGGYGIKNPVLQNPAMSRLPLQDLGKFLGVPNCRKTSSKEAFYSTVRRRQPA